MTNKPPRFRKLYDKISVSSNVTYKLDLLKTRLTEEHPDKKPASYNTAIEYLLENQHL